MLLEFYGTECGHCLAMRPLVERLEQETGVVIEKIETWHNEGNEAKRQQYDQGRCGGVPFFINTDTNATLCGEVSYEELKAWAQSGT
jgi:thiol-disulfide isomerase/thioredoxin